MRNEFGKFIKGNKPWNTGIKGIHLSLNSEIKKGEHLSSKTEFKKGFIPWNKNKEYLKIRNEKHPLWKGENVGYNALHSWIKRKLGEKKECDICGSTKNNHYIWHNINGEYKRIFNHWQRLCSKCHNYKHKPWEKRWGLA
jgi:hypothetical protein